ncbi:MAG: hypothetical protein ACLPTZ_12260 [Beijerinckiaceae bacterium]
MLREELPRELRCSITSRPATNNGIVTRALEPARIVAPPEHLARHRKHFMRRRHGTFDEKAQKNGQRDSKIFFRLVESFMCGVLLAAQPTKRFVTVERVGAFDAH